MKGLKINHLQHVGIPVTNIETSIVFYEKLGFVKVGDEFEEVGIPHIKMEIELDPNKHKRK